MIRVSHSISSSCFEVFRADLTCHKICSISLVIRVAALTSGRIGLFHRGGVVIFNFNIRMKNVVLSLGCKELSLLSAGQNNRWLGIVMQLVAHGFASLFAIIVTQDQCSLFDYVTFIILIVVHFQRSRKRGGEGPSEYSKYHGYIFFLRSFILEP